MTTLQDVEQTAENGSGGSEFPEDEATEEQLQGTPHRRHVEALLDVSDEDFHKELEPYDYLRYSDWEEAVHGWARVAPQSCILLTPKSSMKPKNKETASPAPWSDDPAAPNADSNVEHRCESSMGPHKSVVRCTSLDQHTGSWSDTTVAALQKDASERSIIDSVQTTADLSSGEKRAERMLRQTPLLNKPTKLRKHTQKSNNTAVPIKSVFLPPIDSLHRHPPVASSAVVEGLQRENLQKIDSRAGQDGQDCTLLLNQGTSLILRAGTRNTGKVGIRPESSALTNSTSNSHHVYPSSTHFASQWA